MPPRQSMPSSSSVADPGSEVVCPLKNNDGVSCRKRCFGEKRYRSMQEHIRRAHPEHYISKLPATEDSFHLMVNKPPSERPQQHPQQPPLPPHNAHSYGHSSALHLKTPSQQENKRLINQNKDYVSDAHSFYNHHHPSSPAAARHSNDHFRRSSVLPTASAAAALAQLSNSRPDTDWDPGRDAFNDPDTDPNFNNYFTSDPQNMFAESHGPMNDPHSRQGNLLPSQFSHQSSSRATSLQPFPKPRPSRPRKSSITESARKPKHERQRSKDKRQAHDRKALSAEPSNMAALGNDKKWADLLDAAASATEEDSRDLTPIPQSPRGSLPPFHNQNHNQFQSYNTSPLQNAILPHSPEQQTFDPNPPPHLEPFPSVESFDTGQSPGQQPPNAYHHTHHSSADSSASFAFPGPPPPPRHHHASTSSHNPQSSSSGSNFHMPPEGLSSPNDASATVAAAGLHQTPSRSHMHSYSAPQYSSAANVANHSSSAAHHASLSAQQAPPNAVVQHYCAACHRITPLTSSYACTECICGICRECVEVLCGMSPDRGACPKCGISGARYKPFMLDLK